MTEAETQIPAKQVAKTLGVSSGMLRRYALAFEAATETVIKQHPRDGRQYVKEQVNALVRARGYITENPGMSVDAAIRLALGATKEDTVHPPAFLQDIRSGLSREGLQEDLQDAFSAALAPVLTELQAVLTELQALRTANERTANERTDRLEQQVEALQRQLEASTQRQPSMPEPVAPTVDLSETERTPEGPLVRVARWLEARLYR